MVGYLTLEGATRFFIERWNGLGWTVQEAPLPREAEVARLYDVSCTTATACIAVGMYRPVGGANRPLVLTWDGTAWSLQEALLPEGATEGLFLSVACTAPGACTAVGQYFDGIRTYPLAERWDGTTWTLQQLAAAPFAGILRSVSCIDESSCYALGNSGEQLAMSWDGATWSRETITRPAGIRSSPTGESISCASTTCIATGSVESTSVIQRADIMPDVLQEADSLTTPEDPLSGNGAWSKLSAASLPGRVEGTAPAVGWGPSAAAPAMHGASWNQQRFVDDEPGAAVAATLAVAPTTLNDYFSLWLDMPSPATDQTGYELRFTRTATADSYNVVLFKWQAGVRSTLGTKFNYVFPTQSSFALVDQGRIVSVWADTGSGYTQLFRVSDSSFTEGYAGISGVGNAARLQGFKAGARTAYIGQAVVRNDPDTERSIYTPQPGAQPLVAHTDDDAASPAGETLLPQAEDFVTCASTGHRIKLVYSSPSHATPPTATENELRSIVRRINSKLIRESRRASANTRALTMKVDCDANGTMNLYSVQSLGDEAATVMARVHTALGEPTGADAVKYLIFREAPPLPEASGKGFLRVDDRKTSSDSTDLGNPNRVLTSSAIIYEKYPNAPGPPYWETHTSLHELTHTMGAVMPEAPSGTFGLHCNDGFDVMCYRERYATTYRTSDCPAESGYHTAVGLPLDCHNDTYFDPVVEPGSWLESHWNIGGSENAFFVDRPAEVPPGGYLTDTFVTPDGIRNGVPARTSVSGNVLRQDNSQPASGSVEVIFEKLVNGRWEEQTTARRTLSNGYYEVLDWGVSPGEWRVRTEFAHQGYYAGSASPDRTFDVPWAATNAFITLDERRNGTPGSASVHGNVLHANGTPVNGGRVNVNFQKLVNGRWETMSTAVRDLANGYYEVRDWGVGVGDWQVRAVFQEQGNYRESVSPYKEFSIQPVPTETFLTLDGTVNGAPGTATVHGNVQHNGRGISGRVNVNFQKWNGSSWETMSTAVRDLSNGYYEVRDWGVGVGDWRVRAVFPAQGDYAQSESEYHYFTIQRRATVTYLTLDRIVNGSPGSVSLHGNVQHNGTGVDGGSVNVNFQKWNGSSWETMSTAVRNPSNGYYEVLNWGVGRGTWRVRAVYPDQGLYSQSESEYHGFTVN